MTRKMSESNLSKTMLWPAPNPTLKPFSRMCTGVGPKMACRGDDLMNLRDNSSARLIIKRKTERTLYIAPRFRFQNLPQYRLPDDSMRSSRDRTTPRSPTSSDLLSAGTLIVSVLGGSGWISARDVPGNGRAGGASASAVAFSQACPYFSSGSSGILRPIHSKR